MSKGDGDGTVGGCNVSLTMGPLHSYAVDESGKMRGVHRGLAEEFDTNIPETRRIDSSHEAVQVLVSSSIFEARESRETNSPA